ncbi:hypothetical protein ES705_26752 [subsurface metagenome]
MKRDYTLYLKDILESINFIEEFINDMSFDEFKKDEKTSSATVRKLEIIGEAAKHIPKEVIDANKEIPWKEMAGMRDKITHDYFGIDYNIIWKVIKNRLPDLKNKIERVIRLKGDSLK